MGFLFSGIFWGIAIVLVGISVIINVIFHIHVPVLRIIFGLILIFFGLQIVMGGRWCTHRSNVISFRDETVTPDSSHEEYSIVFGKGAIDLSAPGELFKKYYRIKTAFGSSVITIPSTKPFIVKVSSAFGAVMLPNGSTISFGEYVYKNKASEGESNPTIVKIDLAFGGCTVVEK